MHTRKYQASDRQDLEAIFRKQNLPYELPDLDSNNFIARQVLEDGTRPVQAIAARITTELYLLIDPEWETPGWRFEGLKILGRSMQTELREKGITDAHLWLPPQKQSFERRLMKTFGFTQPAWTSFSRMV